MDSLTLTDLLNNLRSLTGPGLNDEEVVGVTRRLREENGVGIFNDTSMMETGNTLLHYAVAGDHDPLLRELMSWRTEDGSCAIKVLDNVRGADPLVFALDAECGVKAATTVLNDHEFSSCLDVTATKVIGKSALSCVERLLARVNTDGTAEQQAAVEDLLVAAFTHPSAHALDHLENRQKPGAAEGPGIPSAQSSDSP